VPYCGTTRGVALPGLEGVPQPIPGRGEPSMGSSNSMFSENNRIVSDTRDSLSPLGRSIAIPQGLWCGTSVSPLFS